MKTEQAPESCPFCHSARDPVLKSTTWACGVRLKDPTWRTKECYKRNLASTTQERNDFATGATALAVQVAELTRERDEARLERDQALMLLGVYKTKSGDLLARVKRLEEAGDRMTTWLRHNAREGSKELSALRQWNAAKEAKP